MKLFNFFKSFGLIVLFIAMLYGVFVLNGVNSPSLWNVHQKNMAISRTFIRLF